MPCPTHGRSTTYQKKSPRLSSGAEHTCHKPPCTFTSHHVEHRDTSEDRRQGIRAVPATKITAKRVRLYKYGQRYEVAGGER